MENIETKIDEAIAKMAELCKADPNPDKAMKYSQAALNLAHTKTVLVAIEKNRGAKKGAG